MKYFHFEHENNSFFQPSKLANLTAISFFRDGISWIRKQTYNRHPAWAKRQLEYFWFHRRAVENVNFELGYHLSEIALRNEGNQTSWLWSWCLILVGEPHKPYRATIRMVRTQTPFKVWVLRFVFFLDRVFFFSWIISDFCLYSSISDLFTFFFKLAFMLILDGELHVLWIALRALIKVVQMRFFHVRL